MMGESEWGTRRGPIHGVMSPNQGLPLVPECQALYRALVCPGSCGEPLSFLLGQQREWLTGCG